MQNNKGFTLLELIFVLVIGAILAAIAVGTISSRVPGKHLNGSAQVFRSDLNRAKMEALRSGRQYQVTVNNNNYTISIGDRASGSVTWTQVATESLPYADVTFLTTSGNFTFDPRGTASQTANIVLTNVDGDSRTLSVTVAGRIRSS